jgi:Polysaccharide biosynthesis enzyme WcbI
MATFFIIGNCQIEGVSKCLRALHPCGRVETCSLLDMRRDFENEDRFLAYIRTFDFVITQHFSDDFLGMLDSDAVCEALPRTLILPSILFSAFHPDIVLVRRLKQDGSVGSIIQSSLSDYQSALVVYGYVQGLAVERINMLFNEDNYHALGYTNMWSEAELYLIQIWQALGWPITPYYMRWVRQGIFMYTSNHPKLYVLADIARMILERCQVKFEDYPIEESLVDPLVARSIWPVYPFIADAYGVRGSMNFRAGDPSNSVNLFQNLSEFVQSSYERLKVVPRNEVDCPRVREWVDKNVPMSFV